MPTPTHHGKFMIICKHTMQIVMKSVKSASCSSYDVQNHGSGRWWCWKDSLDGAGEFYVHFGCMAGSADLSAIVHHVVFRRGVLKGFDLHTKLTRTFHPCPFGPYPHHRIVDRSVSFIAFFHANRRTIRPSRTVIGNNGSWMTKLACWKYWTRLVKVFIFI